MSDFIEPLEGRRLLSVTWVNRGRSDNFNLLTHSPDLARKVVDAAIADWNRAIPGATARLNISAADLEGATLGLTSGTSIRLDRDAAKKGWYFDPNTAADPEFSRRSAAWQVQDPDLVQEDFYSVVLHEIGHVLGFKDMSGTGAKGDSHHAASSSDLMSATIPVGTRRYLSLYDIQHASALADANRAKSFTASGTTGAPTLAIGWIDFYRGQSYAIYRSTTPGRNHKAAGATLLAKTKPGITSFLDNTADDNVTYYYFVAPAGRSATREATASGSRNSAAVLTLTASVNDPKVRLTWSPVTGARYYAIFMTGRGFPNPSAPAAVVRAPVTTWTDPASSASDDYSYRVKAVFDPTGKGAGVEFPGPVQGTAYNPENATSSGLIAVTLGESGLPEFSWDQRKGLSNYRVYRAVDTGVTDRVKAGATLIASGLVPAETKHQTHPQYVDVSAPIGVKVRYWVTAVRSGTSAESLIDTTTFTRTSEPAQTGSVRLVNNGLPDQYIKFAWDSVPDATAYRVYVTRPNNPIDPYTYFDTTQTSSLWGFPGRISMVVTAIVNGSQVPVGSAIGWQTQETATADSNGITVPLLWANPSPTYILVFRTTSPETLDFATDVTFLKQVRGDKSFTDITATPGVTYYYWAAACFANGGYLIHGFAPTSRP